MKFCDSWLYQLAENGPHSKQPGGDLLDKVNRKESSRGTHNEVIKQ
jgi:hypothetical protein